MKAFKKIERKALSKIAGGSNSYIPVIDAQLTGPVSSQAAYIPVID